MAGRCEVMAGCSTNGVENMKTPVAGGEKDVEVVCKVQDEVHLGNVTMESGREGLRCRFAWSSNVADFPARPEPSKDLVSCYCSTEVWNLKCLGINDQVVGNV